MKHYHAAHHHVALSDFLLAVAKAVGLEVTLTLIEREGDHINLVRLTVVQQRLQLQFKL